MSSQPASLRRGAGTTSLYAELSRRAGEIARVVPAASDRLGPLCDLLWDALSPHGLSWIGFYVEDPDHPLVATTGEGQLLLAARRDKPACSPIGMHGACGQAFREQRIRLVEDVALLGAGYIACDPRDRSELVLPVELGGRVAGVLDADSHELACFGESDIVGMVSVLRAAGLLDFDPSLRADRLQSASGLV